MKSTPYNLTLLALLFMAGFMPLLLPAQPGPRVVDARDAGLCKKLAGRVFILILPLNLPGREWTNDETAQVFNLVSRSKRWLESGAGWAGAHLDLHIAYQWWITPTWSVAAPEGRPEALIAQGIGLDSLNRFISEVLKPMGGDQVLPLLVYKGDWKAEATVHRRGAGPEVMEGVLMGYPGKVPCDLHHADAMLAQAILKVFGACALQDGYEIPDNADIRAAAPDQYNIMNPQSKAMLGEAHLDPLNQYLVGWRAKAPRAWKKILDAPAGP